MNKVAKIAKTDLVKKTTFDLVTKVAKSFNLVSAVSIKRSLIYQSRACINLLNEYELNILESTILQRQVCTLG